MLANSPQGDEVGPALNSLAVGRRPCPEEAISVGEGFDGRLEDGKHARASLQLFEQSFALLTLRQTNDVFHKAVPQDWRRVHRKHLLSHTKMLLSVRAGGPKQADYTELSDE